MTSATRQLHFPQNSYKIDKLNSKCCLGNVPLFPGLLSKSAALPLCKPVNWRHARERAWLGWYLTLTIARCNLCSGLNLMLLNNLHSKYFHLLWSFFHFLNMLSSIWTCTGISLSGTLWMQSPLHCENWSSSICCFLIHKMVYFLFIL